MRTRDICKAIWWQPLFPFWVGLEIFHIVLQELPPEVRENWGIVKMISYCPWWIWDIVLFGGLVVITLRGVKRLISQKDAEYKTLEERAIKAEEKLTTKIILSMRECSFMDGYLYMMISLCNNGYKSFTIETITIITATKTHLLAIQNPNACLENNYNDILSMEYISEISKQPVPEYNLTYNPDDTDVMTIKESFNIKQYLKDNNIEHITKMPLGVIMRVTDYKGLPYFVNYYPCCEIYIGKDGEISGSHIIHKAKEFILKEGETNIAKSWQTWKEG